MTAYRYDILYKKEIYEIGFRIMLTVISKQGNRLDKMNHMAKYRLLSSTSWILFQICE